MDKNRIKSIIESILFIWGEPISLEDLAKTLELKPYYLKSILYEMIEMYKDETSGLRLTVINDKYQLSTKPENYDYIKKITKEKNEKNLSKPALETLSIIAYKQPVTKVEIEELRGVNCDSTIKGLLDFDLIKVSGKLDRIGHPKLYSTTDKFLNKFGIKSLDELPNLDEIKDAQEEN
ncbi:SMC-Scp complex subunit ScpB [Peptoniphilus sp.]|jgi:segregation and condensation protein B|uniref:SMC-Scp complex subunit ScpB n=1 Tax=Peptoniphilus sp. TaxID=1971214 RepID=UPI003D8ED668